MIYLQNVHTIITKSNSNCNFDENINSVQSYYGISLKLFMFFINYQLT